MGDFARFKLFCDALCDSNQKESVVDRYLSCTRSATVTDSRPSTDDIPPLCNQSLNKEKEKLILQNWNILVDKMEWNGMSACLIERKHGFTSSQIEKFNVSILLKKIIRNYRIKF